MIRLASAAVVFCLLFAAPALAQVVPPVPDLSNRIPAPLPPPEPPPIINGPIPPSQQPGAGLPNSGPLRRPNTFSDRATRCLHQGSSAGLRGRRLDAYTRACANDN